MREVELPSTKKRTNRDNMLLIDVEGVDESLVDLSSPPKGGTTTSRMREWEKIQMRKLNIGPDTNN